jgi:hypothetical protein
MKYLILLISFLIFSCKTEENLMQYKSFSNFQTGTIDKPIVYWGRVKRDNEFLHKKGRGVMLFFFNENEILYKVPTMECIGGLYFFARIYHHKNDISFITPDEIKDNYHTKYIVDKLTVLNDSTIVGSDKSVFKKIPQYTEDGYGWDAWLKSCLAKKDYYYK